MSSAASGQKRGAAAQSAGRGRFRGKGWKLGQLPIWLVVWNINFIFPYIGLLIIPIDFHIFQRGGPTTNQQCIAGWDILATPAEVAEVWCSVLRGDMLSLATGIISYVHTFYVAYGHDIQWVSMYVHECANIVIKVKVNHRIFIIIHEFGHPHSPTILRDFPNIDTVSSIRLHFVPGLTTDPGRWNWGRQTCFCGSKVSSPLKLLFSEALSLWTFRESTPSQMQ